VTHKPIEYSAHAAGRLKQRSIRRHAVQWLLARGIREAAPTLGGAQRWRVRGFLGRREAAVVFIEDAHRIRVVTVEWLE